jgi:hypothetical protein
MVNKVSAKHREHDILSSTIIEYVVNMKLLGIATVVGYGQGLLCCMNFNAGCAPGLMRKLRSHTSHNTDGRSLL